MSTPKKLIEVALPLEAINSASASKKSTHRSHPSILSLIDKAATGGSTGGNLRADG